MIIRTTTSFYARALPTRCPARRYPHLHPKTSQSALPIAAPSRSFTGGAWCNYAGKTSADEILDEIQDLYATAKDEFDIASEETFKKTVYAADDRAAANAELAKLKQAFEKATAESAGEVGREVSRRVGGRIRELERAVEAMGERAMED